MKVVFVTLGFSPFRSSGFDVSGERYIKLLLENGVEVTVIAAGNSTTRETALSPNLKVIRIPVRRSNWIGYSFRAAGLVRELEGIKHFWDVYLAYAYQNEFIASLHQSFRQRYQILTKQNLSISSSLVRKLYYFLAIRLAEIPSLKRSRYLLSVSNTTKLEFLNNYNIDENKMILARHYIDSEFFSRKIDISRIRSYYGLKQNIPVLLFVGFINPRKGIDLLLKAIQLVNTDLYLLIVGKWQSEAYRRWILSMLNPCTREKVIEVGYVPDDIMPYLYSLSDVYVTTSLLEGFGLPIAEALACETPVIALDSGATSEVLGPGGILLPEMEVNSMAHAIQRLINDNDLRKKLGEAGRDHVLREFSKEKLLPSIMRVYTELS